MSDDIQRITPPYHSRFYVKESEYRKPDQDEGSWSYSLVEIFDKEQGDIKIGEYCRNYPYHSKETFFPFKDSSGEWHALYSEKYSRTYVMSLPDCKKIAECNTERPSNAFDSSGFCALQYWVPCVQAKTFSDGLFWFDPEDHGEIKEPYDEDAWHNLDFGFVYGCYWGGECYIQLIDLSQIKKGELNIVDAFEPSAIPRKIKNFSDVIDVMVNEDNGKCYGVSVNGKFYRFSKKNFGLITEQEEADFFNKFNNSIKNC